MSDRKPVNLLMIDPEPNGGWVVVNAEKPADRRNIRAWHESQEYEVIEAYRVPDRKNTTLLILAPKDSNGSYLNQQYKKLRGELYCGPLLVGRIDPYARGLAPPLPRMTKDCPDVEQIKTWLRSDDLIPVWRDIFTREDSRRRSTVRKIPLNPEDYDSLDV